MEIEKVKELIELLETSTLCKLQLKDDKAELILEKERRASTVVGHQEIPSAVMGVPVMSQTETDETVKAEASQPITPYTEVVAPLVGIYYEASSPESEPYVKVGSRVKSGDTVGMIEAMKVMNEIKAPVSGEIKAIHVKNGGIVSYDQLLIEIGDEGC